MSRLSKYQTRKSGALNASTNTTGNSAGVREKGVSQSTSGKQRSPEKSTLLEWLNTRPEVLATQQQEILALMTQAHWVVKGMEYQQSLVLQLSLPGHTVGWKNGCIEVDGVPVTEKKQ